MLVPAAAAHLLRGVLDELAGVPRQPAPILLLAIGCVVATTLAVARRRTLAARAAARASRSCSARSCRRPTCVAPLAVARAARHAAAHHGGARRRRPRQRRDGADPVQPRARRGADRPVLARRRGRATSCRRAGRRDGLGLRRRLRRSCALRHCAREPRIEVMLSLLTPYLAFWLPHAVGGSGVLAAVVAGLYTGWAGVTLIRSNTRLQALFFWDIVNTVITGLDLPAHRPAGAHRRRGARHGDARAASSCRGSLISAVVIVVRFVWVFPATYLPRWLLRSLQATRSVAVVAHAVHRSRSPACAAW